MAVQTSITIQDIDYSMFARRVLALTGIDLCSYKPEQMRRRLGGLAGRLGVHSLAEYARLLDGNPRLVHELRDFLTINVTEFFRDADRFVHLRQRLAGHPQNKGLRIWSAGCSTGAEPYSVAILLDELGLRRGARLLATDVDATALQTAEQGGRYRDTELRNVSPQRRSRYFAHQPDGAFAVVDAIRQTPVFKRLNLLTQLPAGEFDFILCRNVVIYFTEAAKDGVFARMAAALTPGGTLMIGGTEMIANPSPLGLTNIGPSFYVKKDRC